MKNTFMGQFSLFSYKDYTDMQLREVTVVIPEQVKVVEEKNPDDSQDEENKKDPDPLDGYSYNQIVSR